MATEVKKLNEETSDLPKLSEGVIEKIHGGKCEGLTGRIQVVEVKKATKRTLLVLSDGVSMMPGVLDKKLDVDELGVNELCVIEVKKCQQKTLKDNKILCILEDIELLSNEITEKIGNPTKFQPKKTDDQFTTPSPNLNKTTSKTADIKETAPVKRNLYTQPIAALNPYGSNNWTIKARVTMKTKLNSWMKNGRSGRVFNIHLLDAHGGEIRATFYNEAADKFYAMLEKGSIYTFSRGRLKLSNKMYSTLSNSYEITFNEDSVIQEAENDENEKIGQVQHKFTAIGKIQEIAVKANINVIGVVTSYGEQRTVVTKSTNKELKCRKLTIADDSNASIDVAVWGDREGLSDEVLAKKPIVAITGCRVSDWDGRSLSTTSNAEIMVDPDIEATKRVREWNEKGDKSELKTLSNKVQRNGGAAPAQRCSVEQISSKAMNSHEAVVVEVRANIAYINRNKERPPYYNSCPTCNKKVTGQDGSWMCDSCNKENPVCEKRYLLRMALADYSGLEYVNCFNNQGQKVLGKSANEVAELMQTDENSFEEVFKQAAFKEYKFVLKAQRDEWQGQERVRCIVLRADEVDTEAECEYLLDQIERYLKKDE